MTMLKQLIIASLAIASVAGAAQAQEQDTRTVKVSIAGIDTHSESGARIMLARIKAAAGSVCGPAPSNLMDRHVQYDPCVRGVTQATVSGLDNPVLTALFTKSPAPERKLASAR
jgi:UrcA family protein